MNFDFFSHSHFPHSRRMVLLFNVCSHRLSTTTTKPHTASILSFLLVWAVFAAFVDPVSCSPLPCFTRLPRVIRSSKQNDFKLWHTLVSRNVPLFPPHRYAAFSCQRLKLQLVYLTHCNRSLARNDPNKFYVYGPSAQMRCSRDHRTLHSSLQQCCKSTPRFLFLCFWVLYENIFATTLLTLSLVLHDKGSHRFIEFDSFSDALHYIARIPTPHGAYFFLQPKKGFNLRKRRPSTLWTEWHFQSFHLLPKQATKLLGCTASRICAAHSQTKYAPLFSTPLRNTGVTTPQSMLIMRFRQPSVYTAAYSETKKIPETSAEAYLLYYVLKILSRPALQLSVRLS